MNPPVSESRPQSWRTPQCVFDAAQEDAIARFGMPFLVDLACDEQNCLCPGKPPGDAFALRTWAGLGPVWCNPPWANVEPWVVRAAQEGIRGGFLLPARVDRGWFLLLVRVAWLELFSNRVKFIDPIAPNGKARICPREGAILAWFGLGKAGLETTRFRSHETGRWL